VLVLSPLSLFLPFFPSLFSLIHPFSLLTVRE
jgi:hypothetical protein